MNVIIFGRRHGRVRQLNLASPRVWGTAAALAVGVCALAFVAGHHLGFQRGLGTPAEQLTAWSHELGVQQASIDDTRRVLQERLNSLAARIGQMNAHVIRLDALGKRLTQMAKLDSREFDFDHAPAQGGPETPADGAGPAMPTLTAMIDVLDNQLAQREKQMSALEHVILTRDLEEQIHPEGRPVHQGYLSSYFGERTDPINGTIAIHKGVDFASAEGTEVLAVAAGVVTWSRERFGYGRMVEINHGNGYVTRYAHNERNLVTVGQTVQKGQTIALMGETGRATGPNLHFEVLYNGRQVNPLSFLGSATR
jgi:murein DD-endopeptidase MepM/ murein hydrolase activator NlpD